MKLGAGFHSISPAGFMVPLKVEFEVVGVAEKDWLTPSRKKLYPVLLSLVFSLHWRHHL